MIQRCPDALPGGRGAITRSLDSRGFTLVEILVALLIFSILMVSVLGGFSAFIRSSDHIKGSILMGEQMQGPVSVIAGDLMQIRLARPPAYVSPDSRALPDVDPLRMVGGPEPVGPKTFSRLRFVSRGCLTRTGTRDVGLVQIVYYVRATADGKFELCRSETLPPWEDFPESPCDPVLCRDVMAFDLEFFDKAGNGGAYWDSDGPAVGFASPAAVGITLALGRDGGDGRSVSTDRIATTIALPVYRAEVR